METKKIETKYVGKMFDVDKQSIKDFFIYTEERRKIRMGKVKGMVSQFNNKDSKLRHFDSPIVINQVGEKLKVIDGNHRVEAIKEQLKRCKDFSIRVWMAVYKDLTRDQERMIYSKWNKGTPETATDYLKYHFKTIKNGQKMLDELPVTIYGSDKKMAIKSLVGCHITAKKSGKFKGGYAVGGEQTVSDFREIEHEDIVQIKGFYNDMVEIFGHFFKGSPHYRTTPIGSFYKIWYDNKNIPIEKFIAAMKEVFTFRWAEWNDLSAIGGRSACQHFYRIAIDRLKDTKKRLGFMSDIDIIELEKSNSIKNP